MHDSTQQELTISFQDGEYSITADDFFRSMNDYCCGYPLRTFNHGSNEGDDEIPICVDYNGPLGNGKNDEGNKAQELINFIGSDCSKAMAKGLCLDEHFNGMGGCYKTRGSRICSEILNLQ